MSPTCAAACPRSGSPAAVIGFDVVRDPDGEFLVLEDNLRTPSGFAYAVAARAALTDELPAGFPASRPIDPVAYELLERRAARRRAGRAASDPSIVVVHRRAATTSRTTSTSRPRAGSARCWRRSATSSRRRAACACAARR